MHNPRLRRAYHHAPRPRHQQLNGAPALDYPRWLIDAYAALDTAVAAAYGGPTEIDGVVAGFVVHGRSKNQPGRGEVNDVRFVKDGVARAVRMLRAATTPEPSGDHVVPLSPQMVGLRFTVGGAGRGRREPG